MINNGDILFDAEFYILGYNAIQSVQSQLILF
jgi:hypothetical protein